MSEETKIVKLGSSSVDAILELWDRAGLSYRPRGRDAPVRLKGTIDRGIEVFFGVYSGNDLIGAILTTHDGRKGWINRLAVDPEHRGRGIAKRLIHHAEKYFHEKGIEIIAALIEDWNKESLSLFESCGYVFHKDIHYLTKRDRPDV